MVTVAFGLGLGPVPTLRQAGAVEELRVPSHLYHEWRRVSVYRPPGGASACYVACSLLLTFDGGLYRRDMRLPSILDSLIAGGHVRPIIAVMIEDSSGAARLNDLANRALFAAFVGDELIPWVQSHYRISRDPARVVVTGSSAGGLAAAYIAFRRPDLVGNVLSQSGAFWRGNEASNDPPWEWLTSQYAAAPRKPIRFVMEVGSTESTGALGGVAPSILQANRHLRDVLRGKGYEVTYLEVPNGVHAPTSWGPRLPVGLAALLGPH